MLVLNPNTAHKLIGWVYLIFGVLGVGIGIFKSFTLLSLIESSSWYILSYIVECTLAVIFVFSVIHFLRKKTWARLVCELYTWIFVIAFPLFNAYFLYILSVKNYSSAEIIITLIPMIPMFLFELFIIWLLINIRSKQLRRYFIESKPA